MNPKMLGWTHAALAGGVLLALGGCTGTVEDVGGESVATRSFEEDGDAWGDDGDEDGEDDTGEPVDTVTPPPSPPPPVDPTCVNRTLAQWIEAPVWPTASLEIGGTVYSESQLRAILTMDAHADASLEAARALIVALLNQCAGCVVPTEVQDQIDVCDDWFEDNVGWDFDGDGQIPYCIPPEDELADPVRECRDALNAFSAGD